VYASHEELNIKVYSIGDGVPQSQVNCGIEDEYGFIWIGTYGGGVARFDGREFRTFDQQSGLPNDSVFCLSIDSNGVLWAGTQEGPAYLRGDQFIDASTQLGLIKERVRTMLSTPDGMWFGTDSSGLLYQSGEVVRKYNKAHGYPFSRIFSLAKHEQGILVLSDAGLFQIEKGQLEQIEIPSEMTNRVRTCVLGGLEETIRIGTLTGTLILKSGKWEVDSSKDHRMDTSIIDMFQAQDGALFFATLDGVVVQKDGVFTSIQKQNGLPDNYVNDLFEDREGNIWVCTENGLAMLNRNKPFSRFRLKESRVGQIVWSFFSLDSKHMGMVTDEGYCILDRGKGALSKDYDHPILKHDQAVELVLPIRSGGVLVCGGNAIERLNAESDRTVLNGWKQPVFRFVHGFEDQHGAFWISTNRGGILKISGNQIKQYTKMHGLQSELINSVYVDRRSRVWAATDKGLLYLDGDQFVAPLENHELSTIPAVGVLEDSNGNLIVSTYGKGLYFLNYQDQEVRLLKHLNTTNVLPDNHIQSMIFDTEGALWLGTNVGIGYLKTGESPSQHDQSMGEYEFFEEIRGVECNQNAVYRDEQANLWFGTIEGALKLTPQIFKQDRTAPITCISHVELFSGNEELTHYVSDTNELNGRPTGYDLPPKKNHLTFNFSGINFSSPERVLYRWKLSPVDDSWSAPTKNRQVTYSHLRPGMYQFVVQSTNNPLKWNGTTDMISFSIQRSFWQTAYFRFALFAALLGLLFAFVKLRTFSIAKENARLDREIKKRTKDLEHQKRKVQETNASLERTVLARTEELKQKNAVLLQKQKMEAIGMLAGGVAHDFNNILSVISGYNEMNLKRFASEDPAYQGFVEIQKAADRAANLVQQLLTFSKVRQIELQPTDLNTVLNGTWSMLKRLAGEDIHLSKSLCQKQPVIKADKTQLNQVVLNLVINAAQAIQGKKTETSDAKLIKIETAIQTIESRVCTACHSLIPQSDYVVLAVTDSGPGVPDDLVTKIFDPFFSTKGHGKGTGLGLSTVQGIVHDGGGHLVVEKNPEMGAKFLLFWPLAQGVPIDGKAVKPFQRLTGFLGSKTVLLVEDEKPLLDFCTTLLRREGFIVLTASSAEEGLELLSSHKGPIHLLFTDVILPKMDGVQFAELFKQANPTSPVIFTSGYDYDILEKRGILLKDAVVLDKPYTASAVLEQIWFVLESPDREAQSN